MDIRFNERLNRLPPYLFIEIDRRKAELRQAGVDIIDFGIGDPDTPTPDFVVGKMQESVANPAGHRYPLGRGKPVFREAIAAWFRGRFGVELDPAGEVLFLIGSKEGIGHLPFAFLDRDDICLVPEPGYPVYANATILAGATPHFMPLEASNGYLPDLDRIPPAVLNRARIIFLNYPNNPTGAAAPDRFWKEAIALAARYNIILASDAAYSEIYYGERPKSILEFPGGREVGIEFHSFSKTFNMTGWRVGFAVGNRQALAGLAAVKENLDSGVFEPVQAAAAAALAGPEAFTAGLRRMYRKRLETLIAGLNGYGLAARMPAGTFYLWVAIPAGRTSAEYAGTCSKKKASSPRPETASGLTARGTSGSPSPSMKPASWKPWSA